MNVKIWFSIATAFYMSLIGATLFLSVYQFRAVEHLFSAITMFILFYIVTLMLMFLPSKLRLNYF